jgi:phosphatidylglycerol:prolipoprotein diacylglycerol transferase
MHPEICKIGPFTVYSYGLMLVVAFLTAGSLAIRQAKKEGLNPELIFNLLFFIALWGIIGARIFYVLENMRYYLANPVEIIMLQRGGLSWFGGLIAAFIFVVSYLKNKNIPLYRILDLLAPFVALGQSLGRIGCFLNGCCFGRTIFPIQLYSSLLLVVIFVFLRFLQERPHKTGEIFFVYLLMYSLKRFFIEIWRADNPVILLGLSLFQIISIVVFIISLLKLISLLKYKD